MILFKQMKLREAACADNVEEMKRLIAGGADINNRDSYGHSVLHDAVEKNSEKAVAFLLENGAKIALDQYTDRNMLLTAAGKGYAGVARQLLDKSPELIDYNDSLGNTPLHCAGVVGSEPVTRLLLERKPELVSAVNEKRNTPLHAAADHGWAEVTALLLEKGASPQARNAENRTPLFFAQSKSYDDVAAILRPLTPAAKAGAGAAEDTGWKMLSGGRIARVAVEEPIGYRITEIFNFSARERTTLYQNLETKAESAETRTFDEIGKASVQEALGEFSKLGGSASIDATGGFGKKRLTF